MQLHSIILVVSYTYSPVTSMGLVHLMGLTCLFNSQSYILHCIAIWDRGLKGFFKSMRNKTVESQVKPLERKYLPQQYKETKICERV